jgi:hypothetical protein
LEYAYDFVFARDMYYEITIYCDYPFAHDVSETCYSLSHKTPDLPGREPYNST